jgi:hypothetical protein
MRRLHQGDFTFLEDLTTTSALMSCLFEENGRDQIERSLVDKNTAWYADERGYVRFVRTIAADTELEKQSPVWLIDVVRNQRTNEALTAAIAVAEFTDPILLNQRCCLVTLLGGNLCAEARELFIYEVNVPLVKYPYKHNSLMNMYVLHGTLPF